jgi:hypothetical protein
LLQGGKKDISQFLLATIHILEDERRKELMALVDRKEVIRAGINCMGGKVFVWDS